MSREDLKMQAGATFRVRFYVLQRDHGTIVGNLTGASVTMTLYDHAGGTAVYPFTGSVVTGSTALCEVEVTPTQVDTVTEGNYWYRIVVTLGSATYVPLEGVVTKEAA